MTEEERSREVEGEGKPFNSRNQGKRRKYSSHFVSYLHTSINNIIRPDVSGFIQTITVCDMNKEHKHAHPLRRFDDGILQFNLAARRGPFAKWAEFGHQCPWLLLQTLDV